MRSVSTRDIEQRREFREFIKAEAERQRLAEDEEQYRLYRLQFDHDQRGLPPGLQEEPLSLVEFRSLMSEEDNPELRAAQAIGKSLWNRTAESERNRVMHGRDPHLFVSPELAGARMTEEEAKAFNADQARRFRESCPDYFPSNENLEALIEYFDRNGIQIIDAAMFRAAFERLRSFGAMLERPTPEPQVEPKSDPTPMPVDDGSMVGIDPETGLERKYTRREVERMSSYQFKRAFDLNLERRLAAWEEMFIRPSRY